MREHPRVSSITGKIKPKRGVAVPGKLPPHTAKWYDMMGNMIMANRGQDRDGEELYGLERHINFLECLKKAVDLWPDSLDGNPREELQMAKKLLGTSQGSAVKKAIRFVEGFDAVLGHLRATAPAYLRTVGMGRREGG
eukprot:GHVU01196076.1.p1 GENE.GHVU01196076.1~~GHVU01196076.1.p1  ORF type:complete len:138 (-),score=23.01 GHVU01196076.1:133-546(-)